jgi:phosphatidylserine/phosphatidylglycerophosphate/cardiolipin synthase-like enzyme
MPSDAVLEIAKAVEEQSIQAPYLALRLRDVPGVTEEKAREAASALSRVASTMNEQALALLLRTVDELRRLERLDRPDIEIAWTGPNAEGPLVRPTRLVIEEMVRSVRAEGEILLVGYAFTAPRGSAMEGVIDLFEDAARRRARITLVLHKDDEGSARNVVEEMWDVFVKKPQVMTWRPPSGHKYTKLHAKALVVDRIEMLVGSANFTFLGLESNLELGLRVRGPQATAVAERFDHLVSLGVIVPWTATSPG